MRKVISINPFKTKNYCSLGSYRNLCRYELFFGVLEVTVLLVFVVALPILVMLLLNCGIVNAYRKQVGNCAANAIHVYYSKAAKTYH